MKRNTHRIKGGQNGTHSVPKRNVSTNRRIHQISPHNPSTTLHSRPQRAMATALLSSPENRKGQHHPYIDPTRIHMLPTYHDGLTYDNIINSLHTPTPEYYNIGVDMADKMVHYGNGHKSAVIHIDEHDNEFIMTYNQLSSQSNRISNILAHLNIKREDRVALVMGQSPEVPIVHAGVYKHGAITVPMFKLFGPEAFQYRLNHSNAKVVFTEPDNFADIASIAPSLDDLRHIIISGPLSSFETAPVGLSIQGKKYRTSPEIKDHAYEFMRQYPSIKVHFLEDIISSASSLYTPVQTHADDPALIIYTSGTTGPAKGALHAHRIMLGHIPGLEYTHNLWPQLPDKQMTHGTFYSPADYSWIGGMACTMMGALHHGTPLLTTRMPRFDPERSFHLMSKYNVRQAFIPPTGLKLLREVNRPQDRHKLHLSSIASGGETLGEAILDWGKDTFGITINEFYGQTECNMILGNCSVVMPVKPGSIGRALPSQHVEILTKDGTIATEPDTVGQIVVKNPHPIHLIKYLHNDSATEKKMTYAIDPNTGLDTRWLQTGDLGKRDQDGYFWYVGRDDDIIKSSGYRIGPAEIESVLMKHHAVRNVAVVGIPDEMRGEAIKAFIVLDKTIYDKIKNDMTLYTPLQIELSTFVRGKLAKHEAPRDIEFVESLPTTTTGKVIRRVLKAKEYEAYYAAKGLPVPSGIV